jgi:hypothetical protein
MSVTTYAVEIADLDELPPVLADHSKAGKLHAILYTYEQEATGTAGDNIIIGHLPPGKVRLIGPLSWLKGTMTPTAIDIGWLAYTDRNGDAVSADTDGIEDGVDWHAAGSHALGSTATFAEGTKEFDSLYGVDISLLTVTGNPTDGDKFAVMLVYLT